MRLISKLMGHRRAGQMLLMFLVMTVTLILVVGLALDAGAIYVTRSALSKAADAAVLNAVRNMYQGQPAAARIGSNYFAANFYGAGFTNPSTVSISFTNDAAKNIQVRANAGVTVGTYFMRIFPQFRSVNVTMKSQATRAKLIMSLVLDTSGSMDSNGGGTALPGAVKTFINLFDDTFDTVGLVTFASSYGTNVTIRQPFKTAITNAVSHLDFTGATFADGGLRAGLAMNQSVVVPTNQNVYRVVVFFTDGNANTFQGTWPTNKTYNVGGYDSGNTYALFNPTNGVQLSYQPKNGSAISSWTGSGSGIVTNQLCATMKTFSSVDGTTKNVNGNNFRAEGELRALATATTTRQTNIAIYCIGLGNNIDKDFLNKVANDQDGSTFNANQPIGQAIFAPTSADLQRVFQDIAARIMLRLTL